MRLHPPVPRVNHHCYAPTQPGVLFHNSCFGTRPARVIFTVARRHSLWQLSRSCAVCIYVPSRLRRSVLFLLLFEQYCLAPTALAALQPCRWPFVVIPYGAPPRSCSAGNNGLRTGKGPSASWFYRFGNAITGNIREMELVFLFGSAGHNGSGQAAYCSAYQPRYPSSECVES